MDAPPLRYFNPFAQIQKTANSLPHWQQSGAAYFITFRLADAIPMVLRKRWQEEREIWRRLHPPPWSATVEHDYHQRFSGQMDAWMDEASGACELREAECRRVLCEVFEHSHAGPYWLHAYVVMPNHAHLLFSLATEAKLEKEIAAWKSVSARRINQQLRRSGTLWQEDYFDRLIRDEDHFANCVRYIRANPAKARLRPADYTHFESELATSFTPVRVVVAKSQDSPAR